MIRSDKNERLNKKYILRKNGTLRVLSTNQEKSRTQQQFASECDINNIVKKYKTTGQLTHLNRSQGMYADLSSAPQYQEAMDILLKANSAFSSLPAETRKRFGNDPENFLAFMADEKNYDEALKMGLVNPRPQPEQPKDQNDKKQKNEPKTNKQKLNDPDPNQEP